MSERESTFFGLEVAKGLVAKFVMAVVGFGGNIILARLLGPGSFGAFYVLFSVVLLTQQPVVGFADACKKRFSEKGANRREIVGLVFVASGGAICTLIVLSFVFDSHLIEHVGINQAPQYAAILFLSVLPFFTIQQILTGTGKIGEATAIDLVRTLLTIPLQVALAIRGFGTGAMVIGLAVSTFLSVLLSILRLGIRPSIPSREIIESVWGFGQYSIVYLTVGKAWQQMDVILLGVLLGQTAAGYYEVAYRITLPAIFVSELIGEGLMVRVSNLVSSDEMPDEEISNSLAYSSILAVPLFFGSIGVAEPLITVLYGTEYLPASALLVGVAGFRLFQSQNQIMNSAITGLDLPQKALRVTVFAFTINVLLGVYLTIQYGSIGVVVATLAAEATSFIILTYIIRKEMGTTPISMPQYVQFLGGIAILVTVFIAKGYVLADTYLGLGILLGAGAAVYALVLLLNEGHRSLVRAIFSQLLDSYHS